MSRSVPYPDYRQPTTPTLRTATMPDCEAERRNKQALYVLENEWGCGRIDLGQLRRILRGDNEPDHCKDVDHV